jgi:hypothetical protein
MSRKYNSPGRPVRFSTTAARRPAGEHGCPARHPARGPVDRPGCRSCSGWRSRPAAGAARTAEILTLPVSVPGTGRHDRDHGGPSSGRPEERCPFSRGLPVPDQRPASGNCRSLVVSTAPAGGQRGKWPAQLACDHLTPGPEDDRAEHLITADSLPGSWSWQLSRAGTRVTSTGARWLPLERPRWRRTAIRRVSQMGGF